MLFETNVLIAPNILYPDLETVDRVGNDNDGQCLARKSLNPSPSTKLNGRLSLAHHKNKSEEASLSLGLFGPMLSV